jgi:methylase of polypeptide subunit release factors
LIWSLRVLEKDGESFTTQELQTMIMRAPNFPEKQFVPLLQHDEPRDQRLVLAALATDSNSIPAKFAISARNGNEQPQNYLDLRFWYLNGPGEEVIKSLARQFIKLMKRRA